jgi:hypothetical protein
MTVKDEELGEILNKSAFYGEPAQLCDAGLRQIKGLLYFLKYKNVWCYFINASPEPCDRKPYADQWDSTGPPASFHSLKPPILNTLV